MTENTIINFTDTLTGWQRAFYAFLAEKEQRSGSHRCFGTLVYNTDFYRFNFLIKKANWRAYTIS